MCDNLKHLGYWYKIQYFWSKYFFNFAIVHNVAKLQLYGKLAS